MLDGSPGAAFTKHGWDRASERTCISLDELVYLIGFGKCVYLGKSYGHYLHHLFWSRNDDKAFVAVEEEKSKTVVTILPLDYHKAWEISFDAIEKARELATGEKRGC